MPSSPVAHRLLVLAAALLFSTGGAVIKSCALTNWQVASFRSGLAAIALWLLMPAWRRFWQPRTLIVGAAFAATMVLYVSGNKLTTAANTIFLQATAPLYLLLLGPRLLGERLRTSDLVFAAALAVGLGVFFVGAEAPQSTAPDPTTGNIVAAFSGLTWALTLLGLRWLGRGGQEGTESDLAGAAVVAGSVIAALATLPMALPVRQATIQDGAIVAYLGLFQIGLAYVCLTRGVRRLRAIETSLLLLLEPVLNAVWAWIVHRERIGGWALLGCAIILLATLTRTFRRATQES
jgi:drug/metabolite transporter (DMT)-like permease